jgi:hypothetical protein
MRLAPGLGDFLAGVMDSTRGPRRSRCKISHDEKLKWRGFWRFAEWKVERAGLFGVGSVELFEMAGFFDKRMRKDLVRAATLDKFIVGVHGESFLVARCGRAWRGKGLHEEFSCYAGRSEVFGGTCELLTYRPGDGGRHVERVQADRLSPHGRGEVRISGEIMACGGVFGKWERAKLGKIGKPPPIKCALAGRSREMNKEIQQKETKETKKGKWKELKGVLGLQTRTTSEGDKPDAAKESYAQIGSMFCRCWLSFGAMLDRNSPDFRGRSS